MTLYRDGWYSKEDAESMLAFLAETHGVTPVCVSPRQGNRWELVYEADAPTSPNHKPALEFISAKELSRSSDG